MLKKGLQFIYFLYFALLFATLIIISFPFTFIALLLPKKLCDMVMFRMMQGGSRLLFLMSGIIPKNIHRKHIDFSKSYIIIPSHKSYIEAASIYTSIPTLFKTLGKKEIERTPIYGLIFKTVCITVDRCSLSARALSFRKMKQELEQGLSITIFPEGTFDDTPHTRLLPFQDGCFTLAIMQQTDLLPILFLDSTNRMHPSKITQMTPGLNRSVFLPSISVLDLQKKDLPALKTYTQLYMQQCLDFILQHGPDQVWHFAHQYLQNNAIKNA